MITRVAPRRVAVATRGKVAKKITVFYCINSAVSVSVPRADCAVTAVRMPCSSMTREVFLLKAFEAEADAVIVMVCSEGACHFLEGNIRAAKRVARVKKILDEIGLDGRRLSFAHVTGPSAIETAINQAVSDLDNLGPNPAALLE